MSNILTEADESYLIQAVVECRVKLRMALATAESYRSQLPALAEALSIALTGCQQAEQILSALENSESQP